MKTKEENSYKDVAWMNPIEKLNTLKQLKKETGTINDEMV